MNVTVRNVSEEKTILEVQTQNGIKELVVKKTEHGYSYTDFSDWPISDDNYYDLEDFVDNLGKKWIGETSSLRISYE